MADPRVWRGITVDLYKKAIDDEAMEVCGYPVCTRKSKRQKATSTGATIVNDLLKNAAGDVYFDPNQSKILLEDLSMVRSLGVDSTYQEELRRIRPLTPSFIPATTSTDASTEVGHGDLFFFQKEVKPLLEVLIGDAIEQGMLEVAEEELQLIQQEECYVLEQQKNQQKAERQRQISLMYRYEDEKRTRVDEQSSAEENRRRAMEKSEIRSFARHILNDLIPNVFVRLQDSGFFRDPISVEMEEEFLPWLVNNIGQSLDEYYAISLVTQGMIRTALKENRNQTYQSMLTARSMLPMPEKRGRIKRNVAQQNGLS